MEDAAPHTTARPALALEVLARTEQYFWPGRTGRWHAVITHFCPLPGRKVAASDSMKEEGFVFQAAHQASQFNSFPASISLFSRHVGSGYPGGGRRGEFISSGSLQATLL